MSDYSVSGGLALALFSLVTKRVETMHFSGFRFSFLNIPLTRFM
jgi:hypothetical protein